MNSNLKVISWSRFGNKSESTAPEEDAQCTPSSELWTSECGIELADVFSCITIELVM